MNSEEDDLYALALGEEYIPTGASTSMMNAPSHSQPEKRTTPEPSSTDAHVHAALFRKLLIGARSQIKKLTDKNAELQKKLQNAIESSGVVICPNCTHHFKDRQCPLRPRAMKKMRARSTVELEFNNLEDMETWLYLNQLETNNDGMPTVMPVKKPLVAEPSLKDVGSLIHGHFENKKKQGTERKSENLRRKERENNERRSNDKHANDSNDRKNDRTRKDKDYEERKRRNSKEASQKSHSRISKSSERKSNTADDRKPSHSHRTSERTVERPENHKRKRSTGDAEVPDSKIRKKALEDRLRFPSQTVDSPNAFDSIQERSRLSNKTSPNRENASSEKTTSSRKPIVWDTSKSAAKKNESNTIESRSSLPFEFKVKSADKNARVCSIPSKAVDQIALTLKAATKSSAPTSNTSESSTSNGTIPEQKYKFVPTSKKRLSSAPDQKENEQIVADPKMSSIQKTDPELVPILKNEVSIKSDTKPVQETSSWKLIPVKQTAAVRDHIAMRAHERQIAQLKWSGNMIVLPTVSKNDCSSSAQSIETTSSESGNSKQNAREALKNYGLSAEGIAMLQKWKKTEKPIESSETKIEEFVEKTKCDSTTNQSDISIKTVQARNLADIPIVSNDFDEPDNRKNTTEDDDGLDEFFPDLAKTRQRVPSATNAEFACRPCSTGSFCSMVDREEVELQHLIRQDSAVPPNGDFLMNAEGPSHNQTLTQQNTENSKEEEEEDGNSKIDESSQNSDWKEFCLEDLEEELDDTMREQRLSEIDYLENSLEESDEEKEGWLDLEQENLTDDEESSEIPQSNLHDNVDEVPGESEHRCSDSNALEMKSEFRLSDDEDTQSPLTSTPRRESAPFVFVDVGVPDEVEQDDVDEPRRPRDDSFIDELDWNYGMDDEDDGDSKKSDEDEGAETLMQGEGVGETTDATENQGNGDQIEEGEISEEEEEIEQNVPVKETKKPMRERIKYVREEAVPERQEKRRSPDRKYRDSRHQSRPERERSRRSPRRRRSSDENRERSKKRDERPDTHRSLLKRRN
ncbi:hypothetical protein L3Y34_015238 [Caenorhabditis briggsae]|uniref:Uncharacterized protein n=1 Tax=Caenorhabditis briggsae TaxID=6238 RepID=A0AAE9DUN4_CAEBR|nr:hypothetical protein L3Y34_015238 [Caenorhabditis briggsae]